MNIIVFLGPPGVGKGTQALLLSKRLKLCHLSTGNILRTAIDKETDLGKKIKRDVESGNLVSDELLFEALDDCLKPLLSSNADIILDGVPRNSRQVFTLDALLKNNSIEVKKVFALTCHSEQLIQRLSKRWTCQKCGQAYSFDSIATGIKCPFCHAQDSFLRRADDEPESVKKRLQIYKETTEPIIQIYRERKILEEIDGLRDVERVYLDIANSYVRHKERL